MDTLASFFGTDHVTSTIESTVTNTSFEAARFKDVHRYVHDARILGGLHYRFSMNTGRRIGRDVSKQLTHHYFKPAGHGDRDDEREDEHRVVRRKIDGGLSSRRPSGLPRGRRRP